MKIRNKSYAEVLKDVCTFEHDQELLTISCPLSWFSVVNKALYLHDIRCTIATSEEEVNFHVKITDCHKMNVLKYEATI